jgi:hypothetical protein
MRVPRGTHAEAGTPGAPVVAANQEGRVVSRSGNSEETGKWRVFDPRERS